MKLLRKLSFLLLVLSGVIYTQDQQPLNIIILIGDGMGVNTVSTSILSDKNSPFHNFSSIGFSITTALDNYITDSAAGATALSTGTKTNNGYLSLSPEGKALKTVFEDAEEKGFATGLVVTSSVTHATPAAFYAHVASRSKEYEIAEQLLEKEIEVVIGAGEKFFKDQQWEKTKQNLAASGYGIYSDAASLKEAENQHKIFALLDDESLPPASDRNYTLGELVEKALEALNKHRNGFVLLVEGSQIDWAAHEKNKKYLLSEMTDFTTAVSEALKFSDKYKNTLVLVTADHETGGVTLTEGDYKGKRIDISFSTFNHTAGMVPVFAKGPFEEQFRGVYHNNEIGKKLFDIIARMDSAAVK